MNRPNMYYAPPVVALCLLVCPLLACAAPIVVSVSGTSPAAIQASVDQFRADLGGVNNAAGAPASSGRREINWDGVPDTSAEPNLFPANFFNSNSPRGVVFNTLIENSTAFNTFRVSADSSNPTSTVVRFGNFNAAYPNSLQTFSAERLFHIRNGNSMDVNFYVPGTAIPATVSGFAAIFADVDAGSSVRVSCYALEGNKLVSAAGSALDNGLSFVALRFSTDTERCARIEIRAGNVNLDGGATDGAGGIDIVAMDDFIYGEPRSIDQLLKDGLE